MKGKVRGFYTLRGGAVRVELAVETDRGTAILRFTLAPDEPCPKIGDVLDIPRERFDA